MRYALLGALLMVAGIAARIVAGRHVPVNNTPAPGVPEVFGTHAPYITGWPQTTYDLVRIGGWALLIFGAVIVAFALIRELRR